MSVNVLLVGPKRWRQAWKQLGLPVSAEKEVLSEVPAHQTWDLIVDLDLDVHPQRLQWYAPLKAPILAGCARRTLTALLAQTSFPHPERLLGFASAPYFLADREWEIATLRPNQALLTHIAKLFKRDLVPIPDTAGLARSRYWAQMANELFTLWQENGLLPLTFQDTVQTLQRIGLRYLYEVLQNLYKTTGHQRYFPHPLLARYALLNERWQPFQSSE